MKTVIRGGRFIDPSSDIDDLRDVVFEDDRVLGIESPGAEFPKGTEIIEADGCIVMPGLVDLHVHFREPGFEYKETIATGTHAAVAGGFVAVCCMANTNPVNDNVPVTNFILEKAREAGRARVYPMGAVTKGLRGETLSEMGELKNAGCVAFTDDGRCLMDPAIALNAMVYAMSFDAPIAVHALDERLAGDGAIHEGSYSTRLGLPGVPSVAEDAMVARDVVLAEAAGARLHIQHVTTKGAVGIIREAKARGMKLTAEATPHHFSLIDEDVGEYDTNFKMAPPLRSARDREAVIEGIADGTLDAVATDHAPHERLAKDCEFAKAANGIVGLETALTLTWNLVRQKAISAKRAVDLLTAAPASVFNLPHGTLKVGSTADITIFDPASKYVFSEDRLFGLSKNSPFIGKKLQGEVVRTIISGKTVFQR